MEKSLGAHVDTSGPMDIGTGCSSDQDKENAEDADEVRRKKQMWFNGGTVHIVLYCRGKGQGKG